MTTTFFSNFTNFCFSLAGVNSPRKGPRKGYFKKVPTLAPKGQSLRERQQEPNFYTLVTLYTNKKENQIFLIYKENQKEAVAKSYMRKGFLIYEEMRK
jgi:hypothetical protein